MKAIAFNHAFLFGFLSDQESTVYLSFYYSRFTIYYLRVVNRK